MALFEVRRFLGDDDVTQEDKSSKAASILKILQAEAEAKGLDQDQSPTKEPTESDNFVVDKLSKKSKRAKPCSSGVEKKVQNIFCEYRNVDEHVDLVQKGKSKKKTKVNIVLRDDSGSAEQLKDTGVKQGKHNRDGYTLNDAKHPGYDDNESSLYLQTPKHKVDAYTEEREDFTKIHRHKKKKHNHTQLLEDTEIPSDFKHRGKTEIKENKKKKKKHKHSRAEKVTDSFNSSEFHIDLSYPNSSFEESDTSEKKRSQQKDSINKSADTVKAQNLTPEDAATDDNQNDIGDEELNDTTNETLDETELLSDERLNEIGGFTVIGESKKSKVEAVKRVLPDWLANPSVISADLKKTRIPVGDMRELDKDLIERLQQNKITHFFPVQMQVIPSLLESISTGFHIGRAGYRPSDICVSAPTGSGKTLAFVLPIIQALKHRVTREVRALVVLPVRDLATQVFKVFQTYSEGSDLKVGLLVGQKSFAVEQQSLVKQRLRGFHSMYDIIVATPGRLVDHINKTEGFNLTHLRFLVIDEADRVMGEIKQDWLIQVEAAVYSKNSHRPIPGPLTATSCGNMEMPLQKLLYSATLSSNPEKLQQLNLFQPKLFTSVVMATENRQQQQHSTRSASDVVEDDEITQTEDKSDPLVRGEFVGKFTTPAGLSEYYIEVTAAEKPLVILYLLHHLKFRNILCFTNSLEATHRLFWIIKLIGGIEVKEFSSARHATQRDRILKKFQAGKIDIIICSDAMARGMDIDNVKYVISYDPPPFIKTYVHRIGRTARAGKVGSAITFLQKKEFFHFKKMIRESGKSNIKAMKIMKKSLKPLIPNFQQALTELPDILKREKQTS